MIKPAGLLFYFLIVALLPSVAQFQPLAVIKNNASYKITIVAEIATDSTSFKKWGKPFAITDAAGRQYAYQLLQSENKLLIAVVVKAKESIELFIKEGTPHKFKSRVHGRVVAERYDDFAWENDRIAFRMYGAALEKTNENAYGIDVWSKRTDALILEDWYRKGNYHEDNGQGLDFYKVGFTLGAGDIAPYGKDSIFFSKNYSAAKLIETGPLRICFELYYNEWMAGSTMVSAVKRITLDAGSQLNKMKVTYTLRGADSITAVIGIAKRKGAGVMQLHEQAGIMAYWEPVHTQNGTMGIGIIVKTGQPVMEVSKDHLLAKVIMRTGQPITYWFGAAWDKAGYIKSAEQWFSYLHTIKETNYEIFYR